VTSYWRLVEELTLAMGPQWDGRTPRAGLAWQCEWSDTALVAIRVLGFDHRLPGLTIQIALQGDRIRCWRLLDAGDDELFVAPVWESLKGSVVLAREYVDRQQHIQENLSP
jgi:hypothetical protein